MLSLWHRRLVTAITFVDHPSSNATPCLSDPQTMEWPCPYVARTCVLIQRARSRLIPNTVLALDTMYAEAMLFAPQLHIRDSVRRTGSLAPGSGLPLRILRPARNPLDAGVGEVFVVLGKMSEREPQDLGVLGAM